MTELFMRAIPLVLLFLTAAPPAENSVQTLVDRIKAVGREGAGNAAAADAWRQLTRHGLDALLPTLAGMRGADATAANWLRTAADAIAERAVTAGQALPTRELEAFVRDTRHAGPARRIAYEWLVRADRDAPARLLPDLLNDPSLELRRDAVALAVQKAERLRDSGETAAAVRAFQAAFAAARDEDQVEQLAKQLKALGVDADVAAHLGFVRRWLLLGPFDHTGGKGFPAAYLPERGVDPAATYRGKAGQVLRWVAHVTDDPYGRVDLNKAVGKHHGAVAYAYAVVESQAERPVEVRVGSQNGVKVFLNGRELFAREEYHHGMRMDQHVAAGTLRAGRNEVLLKVCQNEQTEDWAQSWSFQLRLCDAVGGAVPVQVVAVPAGEVRR
jgi:hypothetical protein